MPGWPDTVFSSPWWAWNLGGPILADVDGDGDLEVLCGSFDGKMHIWKYDGTYLTGWPQATGARIPGSPAVGDVDGDGDMEVVACSKKPEPHYEGESLAKIWVWHHTGERLDGWPKTLEGNPRVYIPSLFDLDGDGTLEIIVVAARYYEGTKYNRVYVFHYNGEPFSGWPQLTDSTWACLSASIGDLDDNGDFEIVSIAGHKVFAWHSDGTLLDGWPLNTPECGPDTIWYFKPYASPALADFDNDGDLEIVIGSYRSPGFIDGWVHVYEHDGKLFRGWPKRLEGIPRISPSIGDVDGDGDLEIVICDHRHFLHVFHHDGTMLDGFPVQEFGITGDVTIADIDGDRDIELIVSSQVRADNLGFLYAFHHDGTLVDGWPLRPPGFTGWCQLPSMADVDVDQSINLAFRSWNAPDDSRPNDAYIWLYNLQATYHCDKVEWGCIGHDVWHTGCYGFQVPVGMEERYVQEKMGYKFQIYPNPFCFSTTIEYTLPYESKVNIEIYDLSGRMARSLVDGVIESGYHRVNLIPKNLPNGIYFARFKISGYEETKKLILMR